MLKPKGSIDARQSHDAAAFVTQCTLSLNDWEGSWAGLCQCGYFVMFGAPNAKILTEVSEKSYTPKNPVLSRTCIADPSSRYSHNEVRWYVCVCVL